MVRHGAHRPATRTRHYGSLRRIFPHRRWRIFLKPTGHWFYIQWEDYHNMRIDTADERDASITFKELYALTVLAAFFTLYKELSFGSI